MLFKNKKFLAFAVAFALTGLVAPVNAYPPGMPLTATLTPDIITPLTGKSTLSVTHAKPDELLTYKVGASPAIQTRQAGSFSTVLKSLKSGIYNITISSPVAPKVQDEAKVVTLYVPAMTVPKSGKIKSKTIVKIKFTKPGTIVSVLPIVKKRMKKRAFYKVGARATSATITIPANTFVKGTANAIKVIIGNKVLVTQFKFTGK